MRKADDCKIHLSHSLLRAKRSLSCQEVKFNTSTFQACLYPLCPRQSYTIPFWCISDSPAARCEEESCSPQPEWQSPLMVFMDTVEPMTSKEVLLHSRVHAELASWKYRGTFKFPVFPILGSLDFYIEQTTPTPLVIQRKQERSFQQHHSDRILMFMYYYSRAVCKRLHFLHQTSYLLWCWSLFICHNFIQRWSAIKWSSSRRKQQLFLHFSHLADTFVYINSQWDTIMHIIQCVQSVFDIFICRRMPFLPTSDIQPFDSFKHCFSWLPLLNKTYTFCTMSKTR